MLNDGYVMIAHLLSLAMALSVLALKEALLRTLTRLTEQAS